MDQPINPNVWAQIRAMFRRHPHELVFALASFIAGVVLIISTFYTQFDPSPSFALLPDFMGIVMGVPAVLGGVCLVKAMLCQWENLTLRWRLERFGLALMSMTWTTYPLLVLWYRPESIIPALFPAALAVSSVIRTNASKYEERRVRYLKER